MRMLRTSLIFLWLSSLVVLVLAHAESKHLKIVPGVTADGRATQQWREMIAKRLDEPKFRTIESLVRPYSDEQAVWVRLIQSRESAWESEIPKLAEPFSPVKPPDANVVLGNRGGEDAFTHDPHTIGFDLERLNAIYGPANENNNQDRIDRLFRHEYTHLLQKAWQVDHPIHAKTPLEQALTEEWLEGIGNYYSLAADWRSTNGQTATRARDTLKVLEPRFVTRMAAIGCASPEEAKKLSVDLSSGRFDQKWGAVTVALWLEMEHARPDFLRDYVAGGPEGIWQLASRHIDPSLRPQLEEVRALQKICTSPYK